MIKGFHKNNSGPISDRIIINNIDTEAFCNASLCKQSKIIAVKEYTYLFAYIHKMTSEKLKASTYQIQYEWKGQQKHPHIKVDCVAEDVMLRIIEPSSCQGRPYSLTEDVQNVGSHLRSCSYIILLTNKLTTY